MLSRRDRLQPGLLAALGVVGGGIAVYLTFVHASAAALVCSASGLVNCERVLTSSYAVILGSPVPTSAAGILWFAVSTALALAQLRRPSSRPLARAHLGWGLAGLATVLYLVYVEIVQLGALCAWCTAAHVAVVLTFLLAITRWQEIESLD
ncbi:MAG TPA: vitamin K epoxide reductase family protein [Candidatus Dormibacteraeota bacterium]|nr:vitamin K epoxide reductase family protein [Candidatus Dormibacteraeota bacterium]